VNERRLGSLSLNNSAAGAFGEDPRPTHTSAGGWTVQMAEPHFMQPRSIPPAPHPKFPPCPVPGSPLFHHSISILFPASPPSHRPQFVDCPAHLVQSRQQIERFALVLAVHSFNTNPLGFVWNSV
jgi:hypothetical protein